MSKTRNIAFWIMIILIVALGIYLVRWTTTESFECVSNPYNYSLNLLEEANNAEIQCICTSLRNNGGTVLLTHEGFKPLPELGK